MKYTLVLLPLALAAAGAGSLSDDQTFVYAPDEDTVLTRTHDSKAHYSLARLFVEFQDEEHDLFEELPEYDIDFGEHIVVTDEIVSMGEGRPHELHRTFDELSQRALYVMEGADEDRDIEYESAFEGATLVVTWDEDDEEYSFAPEDDELDEDLLDLLTEDMDFRAFLPEGEVAEDDTWELGLDAYMPLAWPGGNLRFVDPEEGLDEEEFAVTLALMEALEAEGEATFAGVREEDDLRLAVITFEFETSSEAEREVEVELPPDAEMQGEMSLFEGREISSSLEGELLWDLDHGHLHSITVESESKVVLFQRAETEIDGMDLEQTRKEVLTGSGTQTVTVERG